MQTYNAWAITLNISNSTLNELLCLLRVTKGCMTLKKTPKVAIVRAMRGGFYTHYGFEDTLN